MERRIALRLGPERVKTCGEVAVSPECLQQGGARLDPLGSEPKGDPAIEPESLNLTPELMAQIPAEILRIGVEGETLLDALPRMREAYCGPIAYQIEHLSSHQQRMWLREMIETG